MPYELWNSSGVLSGAAFAASIALASNAGGPVVSGPATTWQPTVAGSQWALIANASGGARVEPDWSALLDVEPARAAAVEARFGLDERAVLDDGEMEIDAGLAAYLRDFLKS